jgi:hypothetical protein
VRSTARSKPCRTNWACIRDDMHKVDYDGLITSNLQGYVTKLAAKIDALCTES